MRATLINLLTLNPATLNNYVLIGSGVLWCALLIAAVFSLRSLPIRGTRQMLWFSIILILPGLGLLAYCFYCLKFIDFRFVAMFGLASGRLEQKVSTAPNPPKKTKSLPNPGHAYKSQIAHSASMGPAATAAKLSSNS